jgi:hypothetical protein
MGAMIYPDGWVSLSEVARRIPCRIDTIRHWLQRDPTWCGGKRILPNGCPCLPDLTTYPPAPPHRSRKQADSLRSIGKQIAYSHTMVALFKQSDRLTQDECGQWKVRP